MRLFWSLSVLFALTCPLFAGAKLRDLKTYDFVQRRNPFFTEQPEFLEKKPDEPATEEKITADKADKAEAPQDHEAALAHEKKPEEEAPQKEEDAFVVTGQALVKGKKRIFLENQTTGETYYLGLFEKENGLMIEEVHEAFVLLNRNGQQERVPFMREQDNNLVEKGIGGKRVL